MRRLDTLIRMFKRTPPGTERDLLPWYMIGALPPADRQAVETWLQDDPKALGELEAWERARAAIAGQPEPAPAPAVWRRVQSRLQAEASGRQVSMLPRLAWGLALATAILVLLWAVLRPGITLEWSARGDALTGFRIYRAPLGSADFGLLGEVSADPDVQAYTYVDARPWSRQTYVYRVEAIGPEGETAASQAITAGALDALPSQLAALLTSLIMGCGAAALLRPQRFTARGLGGILT